MTAIDRSLLTEILDGVTAVHKYLTEDLVNEHLSANANHRRQVLSEKLDTISQKIQSTHPSIRPRVNTPSSLSQAHSTQRPPLGPRPPTTAQKPPVMGPKPIPGQRLPLGSKPLPMEKPSVPVEEEQEMYEVPVIDDTPGEPEAETYLDFEPSTSHDNDEPQEDYTDMQTEEGRIEEEMYEDPSQVQQEDSAVPSQEPIEEEQEMYEEPSISASTSAPAVHVTLSPPPTKAPPSVPTVPSSESEAGYMDPRIMKNTNHDGSVPDNVNIEDWASAYDTSFKKGEKVRPGELKDVLKRGWIEKLGGRSQKSWQKRFCAISSVFMYFYEKDYSRTYNNRVIVPGYVVNHAPDLTNPKKKQFAFKMTATDGSGLGKDYYFRTTSEQDREEWVGALKATYKIGQIAKNVNVEEAAKRLSVTLPRKPSPAPPTSAPVQRVPRPSSFTEQENYEALETVMDTETQEDYVDVSKENDVEEQEEYVDLQPAHQIAEEDEGQDEYTVPPEFAYPSQPQPPPQQQPQPRPASSIVSPPPTPIQRMPLPRPPPAVAPPSQPQLPPPAAPPSQPQLPPPAAPPSQPQLPPPIAPPSQPQPPPPTAPPSQPQPVNRVPYPSIDVHVDTSIIYTQQDNGVLYNKVYVALWDFAGHESDELPLKRGNLVLVDNPTPGKDWWFGQLLDSTASKKEGPTGLFPSTYTTVAFECVS